MTKILYFDCFSGISGDMTIGAMLDLGVDQKEFFTQLESLGVEGYHVKVNKKQMNGITGTDFDVIVNQNPSHHHHRHLSDIEKIIENSKVSSEAKSLAKQIFQVIAQSEAKIHGKTVEEIHFHEVGAIDSIVDIVGAAICISLLQPDLIVSSPLHLGSGTVKCAHGVLPVPAPATADILQNVPVYSTGMKGELVTPTGAAIIKTLATEFGPLPAMTIQKSGYGAGKKQLENPNLLRLFWGEASVNALQNELLLLETNIDDMTPEIYSYLLPLLLEQGALDAFLTNIVMKKSRPGIILSVLCKQENVSKLEEIIFTETSTLGIRKLKVDRSSLVRRNTTIETEVGTVNVKSAYKDGLLLKSAPEYEDCKRLAQEKSLPLKKVFEIVLASPAFKNLC